ncbi:mannosyltransferase family protein [Streptomyces sp. NPDC003691]
MTLSSTDVPRARPPQPSAGRAAAGAARLRHAAPALAAYAAVKALGLAVLFLWAHLADRSAHRLLAGRWDSLWYVRVVEHGYDFTLTAPDGRVLSDMAFFPLLPWLEEGLSTITPLGPADAGLAVSAVASLAAAWGIFQLVDLLHGRRAGVLAAVLWGALPVGIVQSMAYSESLFTALAAWSLYAVVRGHWLTAGLLASLAGLTRPVGLAVAAAVWAGAYAAHRGITARRTGVRPAALTAARGGPDPAVTAPAAAQARTTPCPDSGTDTTGQAGGATGPRWRMLVGVLLAPLGAAGYVLWVGIREGSPLFGYLDVQGAWGNGFDGGLAFARFIGGLIADTPPAGLALALGVIALLWLWTRGVRQGQPLPLLVYSGIVMVLALCSSGYFGSKPRLLLPAFPLLIPAAVALARAKPPVVRAVTVLLSVTAAVYGAFWLHGSGPP